MTSILILYACGSGTSSTSKSSASCPQGAALADGCSGAPAGTPQLPHLLDVQQVTALSILPGSGYTNGTYTWTASGGGGTGATGTIPVSGGYLGGSMGLSYTITNQGSGYTSRPTIAIPAGAAGGTGGSITPTVYQATPHNAATPWNMPGVDYYVGVPSGTVLRDPTNGANLPTGATFSGHTVTVTGCNVTLDRFDFTLHSTALDINMSGTNCTTTVQNTKQQAVASTTTAYPIANLINLGSGGKFVYQHNEYNGLAVYGDHGGSGFAVNAPIFSYTNTNVTLLYNYFHHFDAKIFQISGSTPANPLVVKYNLFADYGSCGTDSSTPTGPCQHGSAGYTFGYVGNTVNLTNQFNTYYLPMYIGTANLTAAASSMVDTLTIDGSAFDHNAILAQGPQSTCGNNSVAYVSSHGVFDGSSQLGALLTNGNFQYNYMDTSGSFAAWYHVTNNGSLITNTTWTNNVDTGTGNPCN